MKKRPKKENFQNSVVIHLHDKGWVDNPGAKVWISKI